MHVWVPLSPKQFYQIPNDNRVQVSGGLSENVAGLKKNINTTQTVHSTEKKPRKPPTKYFNIVQLIVKSK